MLNEFLSQFISVCKSELGKDDNKTFIKTDVVSPVVDIIYTKAFPYVLFLLIVFIINLILMGLILFMILTKLKT